MPSHLNSSLLGVVIRNLERKSNTENIVNNILKCSFGKIVDEYSNYKLHWISK